MDYLKINMKFSLLMLSVGIISCVIIYSFQSIEAIPVFIRLFAQFVNIMIFAYLWQWWFESLKK